MKSFTLVPRIAMLLLLSTLTPQLSTCFAQGTAFTYQGQLNVGGIQASGSYDLTFSLWNAASGPLQVGGTITNAATAVGNGLFTVTLDFGNQFPGADRWLEIGVATNGGGAFSTLTPRQPLTATPYAVQAANFSGTVAASQIAGTIASNNIGAGSISTVMLAAGAVTTAVLADGAVTATKVATVSNWFALTIVNPTPANNDIFSYSMAVVGSDRVLIGAYQDDTSGLDSGAAYLFNANGALLTTFTNPTPANNDYFGWSVAALGSDRVLIGAYNDDAGVADTGAAYLFSTNGTLLTTFTNPTPANLDYFGYSVAGLGSDRILISALRDDTGTTDAGAAYLFSTNGTLLITLTNPTPASFNFFGWSVAAVGSDRALISARNDDTGATDAGAAYLFSTNGTLLTIFTNPTPAIGDQFGISVAVLGSDRVLIGANADGGSDVGAAYLFSTNGALLTTFTNPTPAGSDQFGISVAAVGTDRVLVGTHQDDTGATDAGAAYLFSTNGTLLTTFTNPTPASLDFFGFSVAGLGSDRVLIGAYAADTGATNAGTAYLFSMETFADGLVADAVRAGFVTAASLDPTIGVWTRSGDNVYRATGNVGIGISSPTNKLHVAGGVSATVFVTTSDRNAKENFEPVAVREILEKVAALPLTRWSFKDLRDGAHLGPMAQDFHAAFGLGNTDAGIATVDADGVALAAIQGLNQKTEDRSQRSEVRIQKLEAENAELKSRLEKLERLLGEKSNGGVK